MTRVPENSIVLDSEPVEARTDTQSYNVEQSHETSIMTFLQQFAARIAERGFAVPALLMLEIHLPFQSIFYHISTLLQPVGTLCFGVGPTRLLVDILAEPRYLKFFVEQLRHESENSRNRVKDSERHGTS